MKIYRHFSFFALAESVFIFDGSLHFDRRVLLSLSVNTFRMCCVRFAHSAITIACALCTVHCVCVHEGERSSLARHAARLWASTSLSQKPIKHNLRMLIIILGIYFSILARLFDACMCVCSMFVWNECVCCGATACVCSVLCTTWNIYF